MMMIRSIDRKDKSLVISILSKAFHDNKSVGFVTGSSDKQHNHIQKLMNYVFECCYRYDIGLIDPDNKAVALGLYPHQQNNGFARRIFLDVVLAISVIGLRRLGKVMRREAYIKKQHPYKEFIYFGFLGVEPPNQGNGAGTALLEELKLKAIRKKLPICLETSTVRNLPLYKRLGFEIYHEWESELTGFRLYFLKYEPNNKNKES